MGHIAIALLRVVIGLSIAGSLFVQVWMMPIIWNDLGGVPVWLRATAVTLLVLGIVTLQVVAVCVWQLLTMVRRGLVFSHEAFRYVDVVIGAITAASVITAVFAVMLAPGEVAPGIVGLICGASLVIGGVALVVYVLRMLLMQAVARESEAEDLRSELNEVI
jgi:Protein of unknown function (DUF2975)